MYFVCVPYHIEHGLCVIVVYVSVDMCTCCIFQAGGEKMEAAEALLKRRVRLQKTMCVTQCISRQLGLCNICSCMRWRCTGLYIYKYVYVSICIYLYNPACRTLSGQWLSKDRMKEHLGWSDRRIKVVEKACLREGLFKYDMYESDVILFGVVTDDRFMSELPRS